MQRSDIDGLHFGGVPSRSGGFIEVAMHTWKHQISSLLKRYYKSKLGVYVYSIFFNQNPRCRKATYEIWFQVILPELPYMAKAIYPGPSIAFI